MTRAESDRGGEKGGHRVRRAAAEHDQDRRRGVRRRRRHHASAEQCEGGRARGDQAPLGGRGTSLGQGLHTSLGAIAGSRSRSTRRRWSATTAPWTSASSARPRSCCSPTARTRRSSTAEARRGRVDGRRPHPRSRSRYQRGQSSRSTGSASRQRSTKACSRRSPRSGRHLRPSGDAESLTEIYESIDLEFKRVEEPREVTALFAAAGGLLLASARCCRSRGSDG